MQALCKALGIAGCDRLLGDLNLLAQILMIVALWIGWYFARKRNIPRHRNVQTVVVIANIFFIAFVMLTSFYQYVIAGGSTGGTVAILMMVHGLLGLIAELMGIYLVLRMRTQLIPARFRVKNFKRLMRITLTLWTIIVLLGFEIYFYRYLVNKVSASELTLYGALLLLGELAGLYLILQFVDLKSSTANWAARIGVLLLALVGLFYFNIASNQTASVASNVSESPTPTTAPTIAPKTTTSPAATSTPAPTAIPARGLLTFANDKGLNDKGVVQLSNVPQPPTGKIYQAWFASSDVQLLASAGAVKVAPDGTSTVQYSTPNGENLVALYDQFFISIESSSAQKPSATLIFSGQFAAKLAGEVKLLLGSAADTPGKLGYIIGLHENSDHLLIHADELRRAAERGNLPAMKRHAEHMLNILEGTKGADYGDGNKDGALEDPADGFGYLVYAQLAAQHAQAMANAADATAELKQRAAEVQIEAANVKTWSDQMIKNSLAVLAANDAPSVLAQSREVDVLARAAVRGQDKNNNGKIEPIADEAGFQQMFFTTQALAGLALTPIQIQVAAQQTLPTPTPTAPATPTATPKPQAIIVQMKDFAYQAKTITIDKGTTVQWLNKDPAKHTITSDSGSPLNSKDVKANGDFSFTFAQSGSFPYYCEYHGDKGGVDMAGTVVVK